MLEYVEASPFGFGRHKGLIMACPLCITGAVLEDVKASVAWGPGKVIADHQGWTDLIRSSSLLFSKYMRFRKLEVNYWVVIRRALFLHSASECGFAAEVKCRQYEQI